MASRLDSLRESFKHIFNIDGSSLTDIISTDDVYIIWCSVRLSSLGRGVELSGQYFSLSPARKAYMSGIVLHNEDYANRRQGVSTPGRTFLSVNMSFTPNTGLTTSASAQITISENLT